MKQLILIISICLCACSAPQQQSEETPPLKQASETAALTQGVNHIGFAVSDLDASTKFFTDLLGWKVVGGYPSYPSRFVSDGTIFVTLWQTSADEDTIAFNRKTNVGLHHFAITVPDLETLDELHARFEAQDNVVIEFPPEFLGGGPTTHMMIREPSGLRLEFIVPGGKRRATL
jgi:lactoylglutathione lyase